MQTSQDIVDVPSIDFYADFVANSTQDWPTYREAFRGKLADMTPDQAHSFVSDWIAASVPKIATETVVENAIGDTSLNGLGLVAAALLAIRQGQFENASTLAERAYAADQHEVFAQRIFLSAKEANCELRLEVDDWLSDRFCSNPFTDVEVIQSRDMYTCCAAWLPAAIGAADDPGTDPWRGARAQELRRSILDGDFSYCSRLNCPKIAGRQLPRQKDVTDPVMRGHIDRQVPAILPAPARVLLSYDTSCNLSCPSCRVKLISLGRAAASKLDAFYDAHVAPLLAEATSIKITGSGDPFGSNHFRHVLRRLTAQRADEPRLQLQTNGVLFDERAWDELGLEGYVKSVWVSVDATEPDTYAVLRRDGDFHRLMANLKFLATKRQEKQIGELRLDFVVQAANFRQMPEFAQMAQDIGADGVHFLMLRNWGTFTPKVYQDMAVTFDTHPDHAALLDVLDDPRLDAPGVDLGNLGQLKRTTLAAPSVFDVDLPPVGDPEHVKVILVLGVPRTGSNYLFECLNKINDFYILREVFSPVGSFGMVVQSQTGLRHFSDVLGVNLTSQLDPRLSDHVRANPVDTIHRLRGLAAGMGRHAVALKVFPNQIDSQVLTDDILTDPAVVPVILRRQMLPSYISWTKARMTKAWVGRDLTNFRPEIDVDAYLAWQKATLAWYQMLEDATGRNGASPIHLTYDGFTKARPSDALNGLLSQLGQAGVACSEMCDDLAPPIPRQDHTTNTFDRIKNGQALRDALETLGQLKTAEDHPFASSDTLKS